MCAAKHCWLVLQTKVRDVKYCRDILKLASLGADGTVKLWDPNLSPVQSVSFAHTANVLFNGTVKLWDPNLLPVQSVSSIVCCAASICPYGTRLIQIDVAR